MVGTNQLNAITVTLDLYPFKMTDEVFYEFCQRNKDYRFELDKRGKLIVMPPTFLETSRKNNKINFQLSKWAFEDSTGEVFESDGMFTLPNGAKRAPDAFWITKERYFALSEEEREEQFARIVPDFVVELRSKTDSLKPVKEKMEEYIENGVRLGWLIDPYERRIHIYRENGEIEILENPKTVSGENVLNGFKLDLAEIF